MTNAHPLVAIVIPCYNHGEFIRDTIQSILKCERSLFELVIVNDGSTDTRTLEVFNELEQEGIKIIHQVNQGQSVARNKGIQETTAPYILPVDSDNEIFPELIIRGLSIFEKDPKIDVVYSDAIFFGEKEGVNSNLEFNFQRLMLDNYIDNCAIIKREKFIEVGGYDPEIQGIEDWDLWLKIAFSGGKFFYIKEPLYKYRVRKNSFIRKDPKFNKKMKLKLQEKHLGELNFQYVDEHAFQKFNLAPLLYTMRFFLRKYFKSFYDSLVEKGKIQKY
jgi:glycosyltransferase involved in cell wall biosynthesis